MNSALTEEYWDLEEIFDGVDVQVFEGEVEGHPCRCEMSFLNESTFARTSLTAHVDFVKPEELPANFSFFSENSNLQRPLLCCLVVPIDEALWGGIECRAASWSGTIIEPIILKQERLNRREILFGDPELEHALWVSGNEFLVAAFLNQETRNTFLDLSAHGFRWLIDRDKAYCWLSRVPRAEHATLVIEHWELFIAMLACWEERRGEQSVVDMLVQQTKEDEPYYQALAFGTLIAHFPDEPLVKELVSSLRESEVFELRCLAAEAIGVDAAPDICRWVGEDALDDDQRIELIKLLKRISPDDAFWRDRLVDWIRLYERGNAKEEFVLFVLDELPLWELSTFVKLGLEWLEASSDTQKFLLALLERISLVRDEHAAPLMAFLYECLHQDEYPLLHEEAAVLVAQWGDSSDYRALATLRVEIDVRDTMMDIILGEMKERLDLHSGTGMLTLVDDEAGGQLDIVDDADEGSLSISEED